MVLYFSGTGNSEYIARVIAESLGEKLISANKLMKAGEQVIAEDGERLVFVSPVYAWRLPRVFQSYIEKCKLSGKAYFILTCGDNICNAQKYIEKFCKKTSLKLMGVGEVVMPENYIAMFSAPPKEQIPEIIDAGKKQAQRLGELIKNGQKLPRKKVSLLGKFLSSFVVNGGFYAFSISARRFYATEKCASCGKCEKECVLNNIKLIDGKPVWGKNCTHCMACICKCPALAIEYGKKTKNKDRYFFQTDAKNN